MPWASVLWGKMLGFKPTRPPFVLTESQWVTHKTGESRTGSRACLWEPDRQPQSQTRQDSMRCLSCRWVHGGDSCFPLSIPLYYLIFRKQWHVILIKKKFGTFEKQPRFWALLGVGAIGCMYVTAFYSIFSFIWTLPGMKLVCDAIFSFQEIHQYIYYFRISTHVAVAKNSWLRRSGWIPGQVPFAEVAFLTLLGADIRPGSL